MKIDRVREVLTGYVERQEVPGLVWAVARHGEVAIETAGVQAIGGKPVQRDTLFRIASMSKPVTAVAAMVLVEECKLRLDDPVDRLLPELADRRVLKSPAGPLDETVPANRPLTLRDLLAFTMGFGQLAVGPDAPIVQAANELGIGMGPPNPSEQPAPDEWVRRLGTLPLMYQPGERWVYNTGSDLLGVLIARAAGQPFDVFLLERVFGPLGMKDTGFWAPPEKIDRLATGYWTDYRTGLPGVFDQAAGGQWSRPPAFPSGAGGLVSTIDDYLAFARMLMNGGRPVLSRPSVELMTTDQLTPQQKAVSGLIPGTFDSHGWGFGVLVTTRRTGFENIGAYGWDGGLGTSWRNDPREDLITVLLTQQA